MENNLTGKTIIWNGDSICAGNAKKGNWSTRICERNSMKYKNYAVGGGTVTDGMGLTVNGDPRHCVSSSLEKMHEEFPDADYVILEGGTNDADLIEIRGPYGSLGSITENDFSGNYDENTFCGALESVFYRALDYWYGKKIGFIIAHKMGTDDKVVKIRKSYFDKAREICEKWGIPYIDLWNGCPLNPYLKKMYNPEKTAAENEEENICMYTDGQHLTAKGYDFTSEIIENWIKTL